MPGLPGAGTTNELRDVRKAAVGPVDLDRHSRPARRRAQAHCPVTSVSAMASSSARRTGPVAIAAAGSESTSAARGTTSTAAVVSGPPAALRSAGDPHAGQSRERSGRDRRDRACRVSENQTFSRASSLEVVGEWTLERSKVSASSPGREGRFPVGQMAGRHVLRRGSTAAPWRSMRRDGPTCRTRSSACSESPTDSDRRATHTVRGGTLLWSAPPRPVCPRSRQPDDRKGSSSSRPGDSWVGGRASGPAWRTTRPLVAGRDLARSRRPREGRSLLLRSMWRDPMAAERLRSVAEGTAPRASVARR